MKTHAALQPEVPVININFLIFYFKSRSDFSINRPFNMENSPGNSPYFRLRIFLEIFPMGSVF